MVVLKNSEAGVRFAVIAGNGKTLAVSEVYSSAAMCRRGALAAVKAAEAGIRDTCPGIQLFTDRAGKSRFRLRAANGRILLSSQGYASREMCLAGIESLRANLI